MSTGTLVVLALIASVALCQSVTFSAYVKPSVNKYCRRSIISTENKLLKTAAFRADLGCASINSTSQAEGRYGAIGFQFSSLLIPSFGIYSYGVGGSASGNIGSAGAYLFGARFAVDSIVEYEETNGEEGYQPTKDKLIKLYTLLDVLRPNKWSAPAMNVSQVDSNTKVYKVTTQIKSDIFAPFTASWGAMLTTDEVVAGDSTKVVLTPNSFKTIFAINDFKYASSNDKSRIAIGTVLLSAGATAKWDATFKSKDGDRPNEVTSNQGVYGIGASASSNTNGYFSYQKFVTTSDGVTQSGSSRNVKLTGDAVYEEDKNNDVSKTDAEAKLNLTYKRVWFALNERVTNFAWDPSLGASEKQENEVPASNGASGKSLVLVVVAFIVTMLLL